MANLAQIIAARIAIKIRLYLYVGNSLSLHAASSQQTSMNTPALFSYFVNSAGY